MLCWLLFLFAFFKQCILSRKSVKLKRKRRSHFSKYKYNKCHLLVHVLVNSPKQPLWYYCGFIHLFVLINLCLLCFSIFNGELSEVFLLAYREMNFWMFLTMSTKSKIQRLWFLMSSRVKAIAYDSSNILTYTRYTANTTPSAFLRVPSEFDFSHFGDIIFHAHVLWLRSENSRKIVLLVCELGYSHSKCFKQTI